ncbi:hypothetical protein PSTG_06124 [Puccinia striiformis f. sp. tritici PST-78]|uniref:Reverse transcriptase domain-containing protein n=1 Tax=Puccinia striiformis f. sp. tritici PST-78 TaxID=1165861 RepID=A0A0L0VNV9_9BASI|nr:hypothetical protein PSTG_06124 [Puccinia striiformis f. sp. tritici PST-78]
MFGPFSHETVAKHFPFFRSSPLGAVENSDGSIRPINDLSFPRNLPKTPSVNSFVTKQDFSTTWDDFKTVAAFFRQNSTQYELGLFDWEKAYRQIPTKMDQWPFLLVQDFDGNLLLDTRITFGGVAGCGSFGRPADAWKEVMMKEFDLVHVFRWVDDNLFVKLPHSRTKMVNIVGRSKEMGVKTNEKKYSEFNDKQKFIGFLWDGRKRTVELPPKKLEDRIQQIEHLLTPKKLFTYKDALVIAGRLNHVTNILPQLKCYVRSIYQWQMDWHNLLARRPIPDDVRADLQWWSFSLRTCNPTRLIPEQYPTDIGWIGDASTSYGIGIIIGKLWARFRLTRDPSLCEPGNTIAWLETLAIRLGLLMLMEIGASPGKTFIVYTDNTTTQSAIEQRKSRDPSVNNEWKIIQRLLIDAEIDIEAKRVTSKENRADGLSRGNRTGHLIHNRLSVELPEDLRSFLIQT